MQRKIIFGAIVAGAIGIVLFLLRPSDDPEYGEGEPRQRDTVRQEREPGRRSATHEEARARSAQEIEAENVLIRERFREAVTITSLGDAPTTLTPDALRDAVESDELRFHLCVTAAGGRDAQRAADRAARRAEEPPLEGPRPEMLPQRTAESAPRAPTPAAGTPSGGGRDVRTHGRTSSFDVRPDGTVDPASVVLSPPLAEPFGHCYVEHVTRMRLPNVGASGAHVEMPMPGPRRPLPPTMGDAGVPPI